MWHSLHGFIHNYQKLDEYMQTDFLVFLEKYKNRFKRYFFIRYWLGGPHLRLRFQLKRNDIQEYEDVKEGLEESISQFIKRENIALVTEEQFYKNQFIQNEGVSELYWKPHGSVHNIEYVPEVERYKGEISMSNTESLFFESSILAEKILPLSMLERQAISMTFMYWIMKIYNQDESFIYYYNKMWESYIKDTKVKPYRYLRQIGKSVIAKEMVPKFLLTFLEALKANIELVEVDDYYVLYSHIHMFNNRIGVYPEQEYYLSSALISEIEVRKFERH
ncbi:lantibiotic dehydratase C-terminal domain-containing protein [Streptococcus ruminantium]|uniref:lantibiotic dehydratase C-terminal domain-containing protein n=1 Tax=Streptococcus ruminantium TaxID=1917441 RepID=UPI0012DD0FF6|nr:lantibiotic dehydratase C-terminal domain-containing protein [Streptococcus ruminantium]